MRRVAAVFLMLVLVAAACGDGEESDAISIVSTSSISTLPATTASVTPTTASSLPTTTQAAATTSTLPAIESLAAGLFCRDLAAMGYTYVDAFEYWDQEGTPDRMDADWDGIPCETVWPYDDVVSVWGEPLPSPLVTGGEPTPSCVNGWITPPPGSEPRAWALHALQSVGWVASKDRASPELRTFLADDDHVVILELRYFVGPEDSNGGPRREVERWYIEARSRVDPTIGIRWIGRRCSVGEGVPMTAPLGTTGFEVGTWWEMPGGFDPFEPAPCLPSKGPFCQCPWDVSGCSCQTGEGDRLLCAGPPPEVMGCLEDL